MQQRFADYAFERFEWPESLVVDLLCDHYAKAAAPADALVLAKIHQHVLRDLYDGAVDRSKAWRDELATYAEDAGLDTATIARADRLVFWDLLTLVQQRFRTSARARAQAAERLRDALGLLNAEPAPAKTARIWARATQRPAMGNVALA